jgi:hypothetical protein
VGAAAGAGADSLGVDAATDSVRSRMSEDCSPMPAPLIAGAVSLRPAFSCDTGDKSREAIEVGARAFAGSGGTRCGFAVVIVGDDAANGGEDFLHRGLLRFRRLLRHARALTPDSVRAPYSSPADKHWLRITLVPPCNAFCMHVMMKV